MRNIHDETARIMREAKEALDKLRIIDIPDDYEPDASDYLDDGDDLLDDNTRLEEAFHEGIIKCQDEPCGYFGKTEFCGICGC